MSLVKTRINVTFYKKISFSFAISSLIPVKWFFVKRLFDQVFIYYEDAVTGTRVQTRKGIGWKEQSRERKRVCSNCRSKLWNVRVQQEFRFLSERRIRLLSKTLDYENSTNSLQSFFKWFLNRYVDSETMDCTKSCCLLKYT